MISDLRFREELAYCVSHALPHSVFLSWSEDDQDKVIAYIRYEATVCKECGTRHEEWEEDPYVYVGDLVACLGCSVLEQERDNVPDNARGIKVRLVTQAEGLERVMRGEGIS